MEMRKHFIDYLNSIEVPNVFKEKISEIYKLYYLICPEEAEEIFISDNIKKDGERIYGKIHFFSENFYMETHIYQTKDSFYIVPLKKQIIRLLIEKECYNFKKATEESRLVSFILFPEEEKFLTATKNNCDYLRNIIVKYFLQNLQLYQEPQPRSIEGIALDLGVDLEKDMKFIIDKKEFRKSPDIKEILKRHGYKKKRTKKLSKKIEGG